MRSILLACVFVVSTAISGCNTPRTATEQVAARSPRAATDTILVDGDVPTKHVSVADLESLQPVDVKWTHKGETRTYRAVSLEALLRSVGVDPGSMAPGVSTGEKRAGWKFAVVATASDDFQAAFSVPELFHGMGHTDAYVAFRENDRPIDPVAGPFRIIVTSDGEGSRSLRNLTRLSIVDLRRVAPAARRP